MNAITSPSSSACSGSEHVSLPLMLQAERPSRCAQVMRVLQSTYLRGHMAYGDCRSCSVRRSCRHLLELRTDVFRATLLPRRFTSLRSSKRMTCMKFINSVSTSFFPCILLQCRELVRCLDQDTSMALAYARRYIHCAFPSLLIPSDQVSPALVAGKNVGQSERGDDQDGRCQIARKTHRRATLFLWFHPPSTGAPAGFLRGPAEASWTRP